MGYEEWRPVVGWGDYYDVSNEGRLRRSPGSPKIGRAVPGRVLSLHGRIDDGGYRLAELSRNGRRVTKKLHRLIAASFLGVRPTRIQVNHKDGNKLNNRLDNLEYVTNQENMRHAIRLGLFDPSQAGRKRAGVGMKLNAGDVMDIRSRVASGESRRAVASAYGLHVMTIGQIIRREIWRSVA